MTLSEIENILLELTARHPNLTQELLSTLLVSAGWEEKSIKEAIVLFNQQGGATTFAQKASVLKEYAVPVQAVAPIVVTSEAPAPQVSEITFYQQDGSEEGELKVFADVPIEKRNLNRVEKKSEIAPPPVVKQDPTHVVVEVVVPPSEPKPEPIVAAVEERKVTEPLVEVPVPLPPKPQPVPEPVPVVHVIPTTEPQSLIMHEEVVERRMPEKTTEIPSNLPLLPFESSPHIWSFSKYKDVFHGGTPAPEEIKVITVMPEEKVTTSSTFSPVPQQEKRVISVVRDEEVVIEQIPLRKDDKPLVFLAMTMLLAIILILGYMYSNGRL
jgi:hypothetical protein